MIEHRYCCNNGECDGHPSVTEALDRTLDSRAGLMRLAAINGNDERTLAMIAACDRRLAYISATGHSTPSAESVRRFHGLES